jgi:hypothetical protein
MVTNQTQQFNQMTGIGNRRSKVTRSQRNLKHGTIVNKLMSNWVVEEFQEGQGSQHWSI